MKTKFFPLLGVLAFLLILAFNFNSCKKEIVEPQKIISGKAASDRSDITTPSNDTLPAFQIREEIITPGGIIDSLDLVLLPHESFLARLEELIFQNNTSQIIHEFTGILRAFENGIEEFSAIYDQGSIGEIIIFTPPEEGRVPPICPNPYTVTHFYVETIDWYQVNGNGTVYYLGETVELVTVISEHCTPGGFDQYYTNHTTNTEHLNSTQARAWLFDKMYDKLLDEGITLVNPCKPGNSTVDNINDVLNELEVFTEEGFIQAYAEILGVCFGVENPSLNFDIDDDEPLPNSCEWELIVLYPNCALTISSNRSEAISMTIQRTGQNLPNECSDAFRHAYFNALNTISCGSGLARQFGDAHECNTPNEEISSREMDLHNNEIGRHIGYHYPTIPESQIADMICDKLENGDLIILDNPDNSASNLIDSDGCQCL